MRIIRVVVRGWMGEDVCLAKGREAGGCVRGGGAGLSDEGPLEDLVHTGALTRILLRCVRVVCACAYAGGLCRGEGCVCGVVRAVSCVLCVCG